MPAPKTYYQLHIGVREEDYDLAYGILSDYPILGVVEGYDQLTITFGPGSDIADLQRNILAACASADIDVTNASTETVQEQNWNEAWEQMIEPVMVSDRIAIVPEWKKDEVASEIRIIVNPKMSFGTGHHATTRLMLRFLENNVRPGAFWIDVGTGTGVLAIAAIKLGAHSVDALDNDEWSLENAPENFRLNGVEPHIALRQADIRTTILPDCDGIAANVHRVALEPAIPMFKNALAQRDGDLILSGILRYDAEDMERAVRNAGFVDIETISDGDWVAIHCVSRS